MNKCTIKFDMKNIAETDCIPLSSHQLTLSLKIKTKI